MQQLEKKLAEKHIKDATIEIADKAKKLEAANKAIASKESLLQTKKKELEKIIVDTEKEETHFIALSNEARGKVESRLLASYERIRKNYRNGLAVVPVQREACGGCFNAVPPQRQSEIRQHKKIIVCENCGRVLVDLELFEQVEI
jgi:predicted  nucleic acid-binding Zn-ribbon protein